MKYRIVFLIFFIPIFIFAKNKNKEYRDIILKYDVIDIVSTLDRSDPTIFWKTVQLYNDDYQKAYDDAIKGKAKVAQREIGEAVAEMHKYNDGIPVINEFAPLADSLRIFTGISNIHRESHLDFTWSRDENAYSYPGGDVYLTWGLANRFNFEYDLLMAAYAHELTHFVLQHAFVQTHKAEKKRKKNLLFARIASTINVMAAGFADGCNRANGVYTNNVLAAQAMAEITENEINQNAMSCRFDFGREQVYEADIIAYRFLEWTGFGGETYIRMLQLLQSDLEIFQNSGETRPYISDRIALLQYINSDEFKNWKKHNTYELDERRAKNIAKQLNLKDTEKQRFISVYRSIQTSIRQLDDSNITYYTLMTDEEKEATTRRRMEYENQVREVLRKGDMELSKFLTSEQMTELHDLTYRN